MPAVSSRGRGRRTVNEINMVPFIDVMLVLLIIFMVTAPMLTPGNIDVPSVGKSAKPSTKNVASLLVKSSDSIQVQTANGQQEVSLQELGSVVSSWQNALTEESAVVIYADKGMVYEDVMNAMNALHEAGVKRVALGVKSNAK